MLRHLLHALRDLHVLHALQDLQQVVCEGGSYEAHVTPVAAPIREGIAKRHARLRDVRIAEQCVKAEAHRTHRSPRWLR